MNEHSFIKAFHKKLDPSIKIWKIYDPYQGGVPDALMFGSAGQMLFVEYKYVKALPKRSTTIVKPALSAQQSDWLRDKAARNINVLVVLGTEDGVVLFHTPDAWGNGIPRSHAEVLTHKQAAETIANALRGANGRAHTGLEVQSVSKNAV